MTKQFKLTIVTPQRMMVAEQVDQVNVPGSEGDMGILYDHAPLLSALRPGLLSYEKGSESVSMVVRGGYVEVAENRVTVLAEAAEFLHEIDRSRAEAARLKAEEALKNSATDEEFRKAQKKLFRAVARLESVENRK